MLDPDGVVTSWNIGGQRIKGYAPDEIIGQHFSRFYTEADRANGKPLRALRIAREQGRYEEEGWRVRKDGTFFWASVIIDPIREDGKLVGFAKITRDITERREAQLKLEQMQQQLAESQKLDALGQLTGGVAHDFNNLLMIISGSLHTLKKSGRRRSEDASGRYRRSKAATKRGAALTSQLLTFARRQSVNPQAVDVAERIDAVREVLDTGVGSAVTLQFDVDPDVWPVMVDVAEFETALVNLVINARDAMPGGGVITISARNDTLRRRGRRRRLCRDLGRGYRHRHRARRAQQDLRSVLHHQADRQGHRARAVAGSRLRASGRRNGQGGERTRQGHQDHDPAAAQGSRARGERSQDRATPAAAAPCCWSKTIRTSQPSAPACSNSSATPSAGWRMPKPRLREIERDGIDLVFSDIVMPGKMDGLGLARHLKAVQARTADPAGDRLQRRRAERARRFSDPAQALRNPPTQPGDRETAAVTGLARLAAGALALLTGSPRTRCAAFRAGTRSRC